VISIFSKQANASKATGDTVSDCKRPREGFACECFLFGIQNKSTAGLAQQTYPSLIGKDRNFMPGAPFSVGAPLLA
jgi:hypothetical protein